MAESGVNLPTFIASEAKQSKSEREAWIASSLRSWQ
jgi:hypothetical protein